MNHEPAGLETELADLAGLVLADLNLLDHTALAHALRRVLADAEGEDEPIAAFQAFI